MIFFIETIFSETSSDDGIESNFLVNTNFGGTGIIDKYDYSTNFTGDGFFKFELIGSVYAFGEKDKVGMSFLHCSAFVIANFRDYFDFGINASYFIFEGEMGWSLLRGLNYGVYLKPRIVRRISDAIFFNIIPFAGISVKSSEVEIPFGLELGLGFKFNNRRKKTEENQQN